MILCVAGHWLFKMVTTGPCSLFDTTAITVPTSIHDRTTIPVLS